MASGRELWEMYMASGKAYARLGRDLEAERMFRAALQVAEQLGPKDPRLGVSLHNLAHLCQVRGRYAEAEWLYVRALEIAAEQHGPDHPDAAVSLANLAGLYQAQGNFVRAQVLLERAIDIAAKVLGEYHPSMATLLDKYAGLLRKMEHEAEASRAAARAKAVRDYIARSQQADRTTDLAKAVRQMKGRSR